MSNFGLLIKALPGILLSIAILAVVIILLVKVVTGRWPSLHMLSGETTVEKSTKQNGTK